MFVLAGLLTYEPTRAAFVAAAPIMVDWISAPKPEPAPPEPPRPKPVVKEIPKPVELPPIITAAPEMPATLLVPQVPEPLPEPVIAAPPAPAPVVSVTPPIFDAAYLDNPSPTYPLQSKKAGEEGRVILRVLVNPTGRADQVEIRTSSGFWRLDEAARETVRAWKFVPAKRGSEAVPAWVLIPVSFRLES